MLKGRGNKTLPKELFDFSQKLRKTSAKSEILQGKNSRAKNLFIDNNYNFLQKQLQLQLLFVGVGEVFKSKTNKSCNM